MSPSSLDLMTFLLQMKEELRSDIKDLDLSLRVNIRDLDSKVNDYNEKYNDVDNRLSVMESKMKMGERVGWGLIVAVTTALAEHVREFFK